MATKPSRIRLVTSGNGNLELRCKYCGVQAVVEVEVYRSSGGMFSQDRAEQFGLCRPHEVVFEMIKDIAL